MTSAEKIAIIGQGGAIMVALIGGIAMIAKAIIELRNYRERKRIENVDTFEARVAKDEIITKLCDTIRSKVQADRVSVWLAHNGGHYLNGEGMKKLSMLTESIGPDQVPALKDMQNVPAQVFLRNLVRLIEPGNDYIFEVDESRYNDALKFFNEKYAVMSSAIFKIKDEAGHFIGCVAIGFSTYTQLQGQHVDYVRAQMPIFSQTIIPAWYARK